MTALINSSRLVCNPSDYPGWLQDESVEATGLGATLGTVLILVFLKQNNRITPLTFSACPWRLSVSGVCRQEDNAHSLDLAEAADASSHIFCLSAIHTLMDDLAIISTFAPAHFNRGKKCSHISPLCHKQTSELIFLSLIHSATMSHFLISR